EQLEQAERAFAAIEEALSQRPDDGELLLYASRFSMRYGRLQRAEELLAAAQGKSSRAAWLRAAASVASMRGDLPEALAMWRQVLDIEPLAHDANRAVPDLLLSV